MLAHLRIWRGSMCAWCKKQKQVFIPHSHTLVHPDKLTTTKREKTFQQRLKVRKIDFYCISFIYYLLVDGHKDASHLLDNNRCCNSYMYYNVCHFHDLLYNFCLKA